MLNDWFQNLTFQIDWASYQQLPRHAAYRYEFRANQCLISGRPIYYHAHLDFHSLDQEGFDKLADAEELLTSIQHVDIDELCALFQASFERTVPFVHLDASERSEAARSLIERTLSGQDGPLVSDASMVLRSEKTGALTGAILVTLIQAADLSNFTQEAWLSRPPEDALTQGWGQPHLTWIFVHPQYARQGVGQRLLSASLGVLINYGYANLVSTFLLGNNPSLLWHWKVGFRLISHVSSQ